MICIVHQALKHRMRDIQIIFSGKAVNEFVRRMKLVFFIFFFDFMHHLFPPGYGFFGTDI